MSNDWYTAEQLAKFLKTTPAEIYRLGRAKKLERTRIKGKLYFRYDPQVQIGDAGTITRRAKFLGATDRLIEKYHNHPWVLSIAAISSIIGLVWAFMPMKKAEHPPSISSEITQVNNQNFQDTPNVRATYYRIEGAILLDRAMNGFGFSPADGFALRPVWLKNDVYQNLQGLSSCVSGMRNKQTIK
ncbi:MAG TPA: hypothetical protein VJU84_00690 [Pyrinomonadaceae bacterium]|nr:hypothetical protein [Pyrinomonadaceae bacterium]